MKVLLGTTFVLSAALCGWMSGSLITAAAGGAIVTALVAVVILPDRRQ